MTKKTASFDRKTGNKTRRGRTTTHKGKGSHGNTSQSRRPLGIAPTMKISSLGVVAKQHFLNNNGLVPQFSANGDIVGYLEIDKIKKIDIGLGVSVRDIDSKQIEIIDTTGSLGIYTKADVLDTIDSQLAQTEINATDRNVAITGTTSMMSALLTNGTLGAWKMVGIPANGQLVDQMFTHPQFGNHLLSQLVATNQVTQLTSGDYLVKLPETFAIITPTNGMLMATFWGSNTLRALSSDYMRMVLTNKVHDVNPQSKTSQDVIDAGTDAPLAEVSTG